SGVCDKLARLHNCRIRVTGNHNRIIISGHCYLSGLTLWIEGDNNEIVIGENTFAYGGELAALEGTRIEIGNDCLFSHSIEFRTSDSHKIFDESGHRINPAKSISIAPHVWLGAHVKVLKGASVAEGSVVGIGSIVTGNLATPHAIYAGNPAKLIKEHISWSNY
ncbi:MAG: acyltransferase, partial [Duncaniella sp.]|nr:acyltransferase [Duncaniella sp.]